MIPAVEPPHDIQVVLGWSGFVERLCRAEAALAYAGSDAGIWDATTAERVADACAVERIDLVELAASAATAATPVIPLVRAISMGLDERASAVLHRGATSQDIIDTAMILQIRDVIDIVREDLQSIAERCADLADVHRSTPIIGRTLLQQAVPTTFGIKAAHWLAGVTRTLLRLRRVRRELPVQLGGAVGTLAPYGDRGTAVLEAFAERLGLCAPRLPWHTDRDVLGDSVVAFGLSATTLGKIAWDVLLLAQSEVAEISLRGPGGSSTMPHKRNPVDAVMALASARLCSGAVSTFLSTSIQEHERAAGGWQAEWESVPDVLGHAAGVARWVKRTVTRLEVDQARMAENLLASRGLVMSEALSLRLAPVVASEDLDRIMAQLLEAVDGGLSLTAAAQRHPEVTEHLSATEIEEVLDPTVSFGSAHDLIERALADWQEVS